MPVAADEASDVQLVRSLGLLAVRAQARGVERVDADVLAVRRGDDRAEPRLDGRRHRQALAEVDDRLASGQRAQRVHQRQQRVHRRLAFDVRLQVPKAAVHAVQGLSRGGLGRGSAPAARRIGVPGPAAGSAARPVAACVAGELGTGGHGHGRVRHTDCRVGCRALAGSAWSPYRPPAPRPPSAWPVGRVALHGPQRLVDDEDADQFVGLARARRSSARPCMRAHALPGSAGPRPGPPRQAASPPARRRRRSADGTPRTRVGSASGARRSNVAICWACRPRTPRSRPV